VHGDGALNVVAREPRAAVALAGIRDAVARVVRHVLVGGAPRKVLKAVVALVAVEVASVRARERWLPDEGHEDEPMNVPRPFTAAPVRERHGKVPVRRKLLGLLAWCAAAHGLACTSATTDRVGPHAPGVVDLVPVVARDCSGCHGCKCNTVEWATEVRAQEDRHLREVFELTHERK